MTDLGHKRWAKAPVCVMVLGGVVNLCNGAAGVAAGANEAADKAQRALADEWNDREQRAACGLCQGQGQRQSQGRGP